MVGGFDASAVRFEYWLALGGVLIVLAGLVVLGRRLRSGIGLVLLGIAALLGLRIVLVDNPLSWFVYERRLNSDLIGWRQYSLIRAVRQSYLKADSPRYLAVGSSQTDAVFGQYAATHPEFDTFGIAAMVPFDFVLFNEEILRRQPQCVLLYLSEFDVAKQPTVEAMVLVPRQGLKVLPIAARLKAFSSADGYDRAAIELVAGELLPEFKFRFVFRGLVEREQKRIARRVGARPGALASPDRATIEERVGWLRESLDARYFEFNVYWLKEFLRQTGLHGIAVVIAEGHVSPLAASVHMQRLNQQARSLLANTAAEFGHVLFLPRSELYQFTLEDYTDLTHVSAEAGERFTRALLTRIEAAPTVAPPAGAKPCIGR